MVFGKLKSSDLGSTGRYPKGKLTEDDDGEMLMGMMILKNRIVIHFGNPTLWIGLDKNQATEMAEKLKAMAKELK